MDMDTISIANTTNNVKNFFIVTLLVIQKFVAI